MFQSLSSSSLRRSFFLFSHALLIYFQSSESLSLATSTSSFGNETDRLALLDLKNHFVDGPNGVLSSWNGSLHFCRWPGVTCGSRHQRAIALNLRDQGIVGSLSRSIGNLTFLRGVDLSNNKLQGVIPKEIGRLFRLQILNMSCNSLGGKIPVDLTNCSRLRYISLRNNYLTGQIPFGIGSLSSLRAIGLGYNNLTGTIPSSLGNLSSMSTLVLMGNSIEGGIPNELGKLKGLTALGLAGNKLSGEIPADLANCSLLQEVDFKENELSGQVPFQVGLMSNLQALVLDRNNLTGPIPSSFGNISSMNILSIVYNGLRGSIPPELGQMKSLAILLLGFNNLSGTIPLSFKNLSSLEGLSLYDNNLCGTFAHILGPTFPNLEVVALGLNQFTGSIPPTIANTSLLEFFGVFNNSLTGNVPDDLGRLKYLYKFNVELNSLGRGKSGDLNFVSSLTNISGLKNLDLAYNRFGGVLPSSICNLSIQLETITLGGNRLWGSIPEQIGNLVNLIRLGLEDNNLTGKIPESIGRLQKLGPLTLEGNRLSGPIPSSIGNLTALFEFGMENNLLEGMIPSSLRYCKGLQKLRVHDNRLTGTIPGEVVGNFDQLITLTLAQNFLTGSLPHEIGNLENLKELDVSSNKLSGEIPLELGNCLAVEYLSMWGNFFEGSIPLSLSSLKGIKLINLSLNKLSGKIPKQFQDLSRLQSLNLSFNQLEGEVPIRGIFENMSAILLMGNKGLCGGIPQLKLPPCSISKRSKRWKSISNKLIIAAIISGVVLAALSIGLTILICRRKMPGGIFSPTSPITASYLRLSYKELHEATGGFGSSSLIGAGSFGSVYKGTLRQHKRSIAVKVLNLEKQGAMRSFNAECQALSKIRHRNLLRILTSCISLDFKGNDFVALVYELMPNGNLETWLHELRGLSLAQRLDIAIDVASALDYLHHRCEPHIVHCDLKPSNILLDNDMTARVGDFGLARLLISNTTNFSRELADSVGIKGSIGYVSPEYGMGAKVSPQGDVYSYGILLLEMITGKRPMDDMFVGDMNLHNFVETALSGAITKVLDLSLLRELDEAINNNSSEQDGAGKIREAFNNNSSEQDAAGKIREAFNNKSSEQDAAGKIREAFNNNSSEQDVAGKIREAFNNNSNEQDVAGKIREAFNNNSSEQDVAGKISEAFDNNSSEQDVAGKIREALASMARIGLACSLESPSERMDIADVLNELLTIKKKAQLS